MNVFKYETPSEQFKLHLDSPIVFLAGPTVRGHQPHLLPSWRVAAVEEFHNRNFNGTLILPEFTNTSESDKGRYDLPLWEYEGLQIADCILFWIPRTRELIGLTTNFELGYWLRERHRAVYGRPDDAYRIDYLDILWKRDYERNPVGMPTIFNNLNDTIAESIKIAEEQHNAREK